MAEEAKKRTPRKTKYYIGYKKKPKGEEIPGYVTREFIGEPDLVSVQKELESAMKTGFVVIVSCFKCK